jgi:hypothetical protein
VITAVTDDPAYRELAQQTMRGALGAVGIGLAAVEFGGRDDDAYSWLYFVVDPESDEHSAASTISTASAHLANEDPNGILRHKGSRLAVRIHRIQLAPEASLTLPDGNGGTRLISPWQEGLAMARVSFSYHLA